MQIFYNFHIFVEKDYVLAPWITKSKFIYICIYIVVFIAVGLVVDAGVTTQTGCGDFSEIQ